MKRFGKWIIVMVLAGGLSLSSMAGNVLMPGNSTCIVAQAKMNLTQKQAKKRLIRVLKKNKLYYNKKCFVQNGSRYVLHFKYARKRGNRYIFRYYEWVYYDGVKDHAATLGWYSINRKTGRVQDEVTFEYLN